MSTVEYATISESHPENYFLGQSKEFSWSSFHEVLDEESSSAGNEVSGLEI
jgi:hypothetical protein